MSTIEVGRLEANLSTESLLVVVDSIALILELIQSFSVTQSNSSQNSELSSFTQFFAHPNSLVVGTDPSLTQSLLKYLARLLLNALNARQSTRALAAIFHLQRDFVARFSELLFEQETERCAEMCVLLLRHCTSQLVQVRAQASASLYFLMRHNFEIGYNFTKVKVQLKMALSSLVSGLTNAESLFSVG